MVYCSFGLIDVGNVVSIELSPSLSLNSQLHLSQLHNLIYNGRLLADAEVALGLPNRGLQFNDGFFETLVWADGRVRYLPYHLRRMRAAAAAMRLPLPSALANEAALTQTLGGLAASQALPAARLRVQLWRGGGGLYAPPADVSTEFIATAAPFQPHDAPVGRADFAQGVRAVFSPVSFCKGPHAVFYVLAAQERQQRGLDEILLLDGAGHVAESGAAAVWWVRAGQLYTPALTTGCVAGVRRAHLLQVARARGVVCHEGQFGPAELLAAEAVFLANVAGLREVRQVGATVFPAGPHPLLAALRGWDGAYSAPASGA